MNLTYILISILILLSILSISIYHFVFNIYEVVFSVAPDKLYADDISTVKISAVPVNSFGFKPPFRYSDTTFRLEKGGNLVSIIKYNRVKGTVVIKAKDKTGSILVRAKSKHAMFYSSFEIEIYPAVEGNNFI